MKKNPTLLILIIIFLLFLFYLFIKKDKELNTFKFPDTVIVNNHTEFQKIDTISMVITNKILKIDTIQIDIFYSPIDMSNDNYEIYGFTFPNQFEKNKYYIYINPKFKYNLIKLLSHEISHIKQHLDGLLIYPSTGMHYIDYKGEKIYFGSVIYEKRQYEIDAFKMQKEIEKKLNEILYK